MSVMAEIIGINQKKTFTLEEARALLPVIKRITRASFDEVDRLARQMDLLPEGVKKESVELEIQALFREWLEKMRRLGVEAKGSWLVDFDSGEGYYCWRYPEPEVSHYHGYTEGFGGRVKIH